jgi:hypothetical protein
MEKLFRKESCSIKVIGTNSAEVKFEKKVAAEMVLVTLIFDDENYCTKRLIME